MKEVAPKGFFMIVSIIFSAIAICVSVALSQSLQLAQQSEFLRYYYYKTQFMARSGIVYAPNHWTNIPTIDSQTSKSQLYLSNGLTVPNLDGIVYLLKTNSTLYCIAKGPRLSRAIYYCSYTESGGTDIQLGPLQKY